MSTPYNHLLHLARAGANVLHLASYEWERVQGWAIGLSQELQLPLRLWSQSSGLLAIGADGERALEDDRLIDPLDLLKQIQASEEGGIWLMEDMQPFLEPQHHPILRLVRELCRMPSAPRRVVLLSTPLPGLPADLRKEIPTIELPLPGVDELRMVAAQVAEVQGVRLDQTDALFEAARGLTVMEARLAYGQAAVALGRLGSAAVPMVAREKERIIRASEVLEYYEPDARLNDVGGLRHLKAWLTRRGHAFGQGAREYGLDAPKGVLLLGVQGCGKSLVAKAIASAWEFPLLRFDLGKVFGSLVGQSEGSMRNALAVSQAIAPCVLWIDEIEKGLAGMGSSDATDGGTTARVVGTLLTWMQEKREPVFVVATANRIELLPPELLRKGRFDEIFFVDLPTRSVRREILEIHLRRKGRSPVDFDLDALAGASVGYSGAELEEAVKEALFDAYAEGREVATPHIAAALGATYPLSRTMRDQIDELRRWARARARLAGDDEPETLPSEEGQAVPRLRQETRNPFIPTGKA